MASLSSLPAKCFISSAERIEGMPNLYRVKLADTIKNLRTLSIDYCMVPYSWYDVPSTYYVPLIEATDIIPVGVPPQHYTPTELAAALSTALTAATTIASTYTVTYDADTLGYTISSTGAFELAWTSDPNALDSNYMWYALGFGNATTGPVIPAPDSGSGTTFTSTTIGQLAPHLICITLRPNLPISIISDLPNLTCNCIVPISANFGDKIEYNVNSNFKQTIWCEAQGVHLTEVVVEMV